MNFLAHAVLSFQQPDILFGNMVSDFVKGRKQYDYPAAIHVGMLLHRAIDLFTDEHPVTKQIKTYYQKEYRLYSGPLADVSYDYFLANDVAVFSNDAALQSFSSNTYQQLETNRLLFPSNFQNIFTYMKEQDWLYHYHSDIGISKSFFGLQRRAKYMPPAQQAIDIFMQKKLELKQLYDDFFPEVKKYSFTKLEHLINAASLSLNLKK